MDTVSLRGSTVSHSSSSSSHFHSSASPATAPAQRHARFNNMLWSSPAISPRTKNNATFESTDSMSPKSISSASFASTSSQPRVTFRKLQKRNKPAHNLDFGCAGDESSWTGAGPSDLSDRIYSSKQGMNRYSMESTSTSTSHSRAHSSSSNVSALTSDSSVPPSPTFSSYSKESWQYTSRLPLSPRAAEKQRSYSSASEDGLGIEALADVLGRVRLSRVEEDVRGSIDNGTPIRRSSSVPVLSQSVPEDIDFEVDILPVTKGSTFKPLLSVDTFNMLVESPDGSVSPVTILAEEYEADSNTREERQTIVGSYGSPIASEPHQMASALDELSEYFANSPRLSTATARPTSATHKVSHSLPSSPLKQSSTTKQHLRATSAASAATARSAGPRPKLVGKLAPGLSAKTFDAIRAAPEQRVDYGWI